MAAAETRRARVTGGTPPGTSPGSSAALPRILGAPSAAALMVGLTIGSGIFRVPSVVADSVESVGAIALVWLVGGGLAVCGALVVGELSTMYPAAGGVYVFLREAYGPLPAFLYGWTRLLLLVPASVGAISLILAAYLTPLLPIAGLSQRWVAGAVIALITALNYRSLLWGAVVENTLTTLKLIAVAGLAVALTAFGGPGGGALAAPVRLAPASWTGFGLALVTAMWTYSGWSSIASLAGEVRDPGRNMPRAIIGGMIAVLLVYVAINAAYLYVLPVSEMAASSLVAADAAFRVFGAWGRTAVAAIVVVATLGALQASLMHNPRIFYAMANDRLLLSPVGRVHRRYLTPHVATLFTALLGIGYVLMRSFEQLTQAFILGVWPFHILTVWAVFRLRRRRPELDRPYRTWGYPVVPAVFLGVSLGMILNAMVQRTGLTLFGFVLILAGIPLYLLRRRYA